MSGPGSDLQGLGDPLAGVLRGPLVDTADTLLESGPVREVWKEANRSAHEAVVAILEDDVGDNISTSGGKIVIDLGAVLREVGEQIGLPEAVLDAIPEDAGLFEVVDSDRLEAAQNGVKVIKILSVVTFLSVVILYGAAVYLAGNGRREAVRNVGFATALGGFIVLVALGLGINVVAGTPDTPGGRAGSTPTDSTPASTTTAPSNTRTTTITATATASPHNQPVRQTGSASVRCRWLKATLPRSMLDVGRA